jgi:hypothetical protein
MADLMNLGRARLVNLSSFFLSEENDKKVEEEQREGVWCEGEAGAQRCGSDERVSSLLLSSCESFQHTVGCVVEVRS